MISNVATKTIIKLEKKNYEFTKSIEIELLLIFEFSQNTLENF